MTRRFSPQELTLLRNRVPITHLIKTLLEMPARSSNGKLTFACPSCGGYDTSIHTAHNLARCFACRKNFNPIELVMYHLQMGFVDSVRWLKCRIPETPAQNKPSGNTQPSCIGDILADVIPSPPNAKAGSTSEQSILQRLSALEDSVRHLCRVIDKLRSSLDR